MHLGSRVVPLDLLLDLEQLGRLGRDEPDLVGGEREQPGTDRADRAGRADDHRLAVDDAVLVGLDDVEPTQRLVSRPERARGAVAVAGRDRQRCLFGDGHPGVADDLRERPEPHDLRTQPARQVGGLQQA